MGIELCRLYIGPSQGLPPQGRDGIFYVIDEIALRSSKRNRKQTTTNSSGQVQDASSGFNYDQELFLDKYIKPVHIIQSPFERITFPEISGDMIEAIMSESAPTQAIAGLIGIDDNAEGMVEMENLLGEASDLLSDPTQLIALLLSQFYVVEVLLPSNASCITTPAYGHLVRKPASPNEVSSRTQLENKIGSQ